MQNDPEYAATSRTVETPVGELHYHEAGDGPPLLLLHGSGPGVSAWSNFRGNLAAFAAGYRTLALDFPGFGVSASCDGSPLAAAAPAVTAFLDALGLESVAIVGNSMGGNVASQVAAAHPDRVSRLVTIGGVGTALFATSPSEGVKLLVQFVEDPTRERLVTWMESMVFDPSILTEEFVELRWQVASKPEALADVKRMFNSKVLGMMRRAPLAAPDQVATLAKIKAPTLITWGRDDRVTPLDSMLVPMRVIRNCELHVFPDCGHWAMIERKAEFERVTLEFLGRP
ncbi:MAG: alpha/beta fold hydrolase [Acidimicrobiales bacterium]|nr:alpha/beta fold hydrolase [Acidimicrobiales bacterium]